VFIVLLTQLLLWNALVLGSVRKPVVMFVVVRPSASVAALDVCLRLCYSDSRMSVSMLGGSVVITAWCVLRLRMEGRPPDTEGGCEYIE
jgi:hypothetical protein